MVQMNLVENGLVDTVGEGEGGTNRESSTNIYTLPRAKQIARGKVLYNRELSSALCDDLEQWNRAWGWYGVSGEKGDIYIYIYI